MPAATGGSLVGEEERRWAVVMDAKGLPLEGLLGRADATGLFGTALLEEAPLVLAACPDALLSSSASWLPLAPPGAVLGGACLGVGCPPGWVG